MNVPVEPGLTPDEALRRAQAWWHAAASSPTGPYRADAERAAAYWYAQHQALVAAVPAYGVHVPAPPPAYGSAGPVGYGAGPRGRRRAGRVVRGVVFAVVASIAVGASLAGGLREVAEGALGRDEIVGLPTEQDGAVPPPTVWDDPSPDASADGLEARWRAGEYAETLPDPVPGAAQTTPFLADYPDPTEWVVALNPANEGVRVVFTDDPTLNCGMAHVEEHDAFDRGYAGCFHPAYPRVLFVWWADGASPASKQVLLAHELSHMIQWWQRFDLLQSASDAGLAEDEEWQHALETDATCRVLSWGGYSAAAADRTSSPCDTDEWSESWLDERAAALGVVVRDY